MLWGSSSPLTESRIKPRNSCNAGEVQGSKLSHPQLMEMELSNLFLETNFKYILRTLKLCLSCFTISFLGNHCKDKIKPINKDTSIECAS